MNLNKVTKTYIALVTMKCLGVIVLSFFSIAAHSQHNISYPADTLTTVYIEGYSKDTIINYHKLYKQPVIQLKCNNPDYTIIKHELWWTCPEANYQEYTGDTLSHTALKRFGGSNFMLMIRRVLVKNKSGYYFWINDRTYSLKD